MTQKKLRKFQKKANAPTDLDEAIKAYKEITTLRGPEPLLRWGLSDLDDFTKKYLKFSKNIIDKDPIIGNSIGFILHYDLNKLTPESAKEFVIARDAFKNFVELMLSGASSKDIEAQKNKAKVYVVKGPDQVLLLDAIQNVILATLGIEDFDTAREITIKALKAMNELPKKKEHNLAEPNQLTELVSVLEPIVLKGDTVPNLKASIEALEKVQGRVQELNKKFRP